MRRLSSILLLAWGASLSQGGDSRAPEQFGAYWARVSDRAEVELLVDGLRGTTTPHGGEWIARKHAAPGVRIAFTQAESDRSAVRARSKADHYDIREHIAHVQLRDGGALSFEKTTSMWKLTSGVIPSPPSAGLSTADMTISAGPATSVGETFISTPLSKEHGIERLSRSTTRARLSRELLSSTGKTASYYHVRYSNSAPFVRATYIQFVVDREWNRILYGNMNHWIKAYTNVVGPSAVATDADGRVFIGETGNNRITVLQISGEEEQAHLVPAFSINNITEPSDISLSDNGTPLDVSDDLLYVADAATNQILKYSVGSSSATLLATFEGFDSPTGVLVGKWDGAASGLLYVIDGVGRRLRMFDDQGTSLTLLKEIKADHRRYFQCLKADHFGNLYVVDNASSQILKYTADLQFLDADGSKDAFSALGNVDIPFGKIEIEDEGTYWAGFDQIFAAERWDEQSGAQRRTLGLSLKDIEFSTDADMSGILNTFTLTDFGVVSVRLYDGSNRLIRTLNSAWMVSGEKNILWDRRDDNGQQVPPGTYRYEIEAQSAYRDEPTASQTQFYLPMFYWQDCGSGVVADDAMLVQGSAVAWGSGPSLTANEHATAVQYRFAGLNPESKYEVAVEFVTGDGIPRMQDMTIDGMTILAALQVTSSPQRTDFIALPEDSYKDGNVTLSINKRGEGTAIVSQIWLKEVGVGFNTLQIEGAIPTSYSLEQNYPNPFNPSTVIRYAIPQDGLVTLKVYDITGREVVTLVNENRAAGTYEARFDVSTLTGGKNLASGVYLYRVQAGKFSEAKKMLLLK